jgi:ATP/maltotriose-dependent transcriptional regulator MalT/DNA-binding SARP family transcriptional activator
VPVLAKLTRPRLHQVVQRERLFERLDHCRERPLAWIAGPPGAGKTTLVASYIEARRIGGLWYHVDAGDRDLATFFHYLSEAAAATGRKRVAPLPRLGPEHRADLPGFARIYFRALFTRLKTPAAIVLDNYHELPSECELHALLETIAGEVPDDVCLIVISRGEPPPACAALRALGKLAPIDWDDLRLTYEETRRIAALRHVVDDDALRAAHEQADGWPVGLTLTLERIKRFGADAAGARDEGRELLFTYFAGQIFAALPETTRKVLMRTALLPRASADQAVRVSGEADAGALLDGLYRRRLFVDRRGDSYQFHDLFRAFLLQEFERTHDAEQVMQLRTQAVRVLQGSGQAEDAFALACLAQNWDAASVLVLTFAPMLFEQGRGPTLRQWLGALPVELVDANPWLGLWLAIGMSGIAPGRARERFARTFEQFRASEDDVGRVLCLGGVIMTHYFELDDLSTLDRWIDELLAMLKKAPRMPAAAAELRVHTALLFALSFRRPLPELVRPCIARLYELLHECPLNARIDAASLLLAHHANSADFDSATRLVAMVQPWLSDPGPSPFYAALWWFHVGHYRLKLGEAEPAVAAYERALAIARDNAMTIPVLKVYCPVGIANVALTQGDAVTAEAQLAQTAQHWTSARRIDSAMETGFRALIAAHRGDMAQALPLARRLVELNEVLGIVWHQYYARIELGFMLAETGALDELAPVLDAARALTRGTTYARLAYEPDLIDAYATLLHGDSASANAKLADALRASREDVGKFFSRTLPRLLPRLFAHALAEGIDTDYVRRSIRRYRLRAPDHDVPDWPWPIEIRTLGTFEVLCDGKPPEFSRKLPRKTLALLKAMVTFGGHKVSEQRLIDTFWADEEGDVAARSLYATVLRLRGLLGDSGAVIQQGGKLSLDRELVWTDAFAFESALSNAERAARAGDPQARRLWERTIALYRGAFLAEDEGETWPVAMRERLRGRFIHALVAFGRELEHAGDIDAAITAYQRGLEADAVVEPFYQGLMRCYQRLERCSEAISAYRRLKQVLSVTLGLAPSAATERIYQTLR